MVDPRLRTAALPNELLNKRGKRVEVRICAPVDISRMESLPGDAGATAHLKMRSELLGKRVAGIADIAASSTPIAKGVAMEILRSEVAGEGSGEPFDIDRYNNHYMHLFVWNIETAEVVGAYWVGDIPKILSCYGSCGLYTKSLFHFHPGFFHRLGPALELGRSFVRPEYQRQFTPLLLLWNGIGQFVARHPEYKKLIGPVSVSKRYSPASRELIAGYFEHHIGIQG